MALTGKLSIEVGIQASAAKFFKLFATELHDVQNHADTVHETMVHQGDWHSIGSVKQWTYTLDGKVVSCKEKVESIDEEKKTITYSLFDGDVAQKYKTFKLIFQVIDKNDGRAAVNWTIEYERINEDIQPPFSYIEYFYKSTTSIDGNLPKA
ncbi:MLP-like protein 34 [Gastrolobium bilobum]|uniref:MLP-like protein 34 n=1 Tax=Gastrolobium bilobum TaxID=150636 RepID=UPI002AB2F4E3|nr:MLP-like protein 34 [Gastrolobium bilobum]